MQQKPKRRLTKTEWLTGVSTLILAPSAVLWGVYGMDDRKYYFISLIIIICAMLPFFLLFEHRRPQARELVTLSVLCAVAVAGRAAFYMLPQFKPVAAIVIIAGVSLGAQSGFLVGAVSAFVSNFFFGQGPNTPWQMFAFGIIGFLAGILYERGPLKTSRLSLCIFGGASTLLLYGGIVNAGTLLISGLPVTLPAYLAVCLGSLPFDLIHAVASVIFLFFISQPMIEKIERIKKKYGLM
ncbi:ECF transporter S component [Caproiciproducens sp.]|uniref:ECF transporter S component n=1 Tax=Caproiciproducens sp. TaxID=1954376 RepID=UPI00289A2E9B|nr:ECF transporter S component [Caproiciproducens sp.]